MKSPWLVAIRSRSRYPILRYAFKIVNIRLLLFMLDTFFIEHLNSYIQPLACQCLESSNRN